MVEIELLLLFFFLPRQQWTAREREKFNELTTYYFISILTNSGHLDMIWLGCLQFKVDIRPLVKPSNWLHLSVSTKQLTYESARETPPPSKCSKQD